MPESEAKKLIRCERDALSAYWDGDQSEPFVLPRRSEYCVCDVIFPSLIANIGLGLRCLMAGLAQAVPFSGLKIAIYRFLGVKIGHDVFISPGAFVDPFYPRLITLEDGAFLGMGCRLMTHEYTVSNFRIGRVTVGRDAVIGLHATVRCGVKVGTRANVGCDSFVNKDVPEGATVGGVPAKILRSPEG